MIKKILKNKELRLVAFSQMIQLFGGVVLVKLLAVLLTKSDYGYYSLALSIFTLVSIMPFTAFDQGVARYISVYKEKHTLKKYYINIFVIYISILLVYLILFYSTRNLFNLSNEWFNISGILSIFIITEIFKTTIFSIETASRDRKLVTFQKLFEYCGKIALIYIVYKYFQLDIKSLFFVYSIININIIVYSLIKNKDNIEFSSINKKNITALSRDILLFSYPLLTWALFGWFQNMSNRWLLNAFLNESIVAEFSMLSSMALLPPNAILGIVNGFIIPIIYERENTERGYARKTLNVLLPVVGLIYGCMIIFTFIFNKQIILILADAKYIKNAWMLPYMLISGCIFTLSMMSTYEIFAHKKTKKLILPNIIPGISSMLFGYFAIKYYGLMGALVNFMLTYIIYGILTTVTVVKYKRSYSNND